MMTKRYMKDALMGVCAFALFVMVGVMMITAWAGHPAEQPIDGYTYMETIGGVN